MVAHGPVFQATRRVLVYLASPQLALRKFGLVEVRSTAPLIARCTRFAAVTSLGLPTLAAYLFYHRLPSSHPTDTALRLPPHQRASRAVNTPGPIRDKPISKRIPVYRTAARARFAIRFISAPTWKSPRFIN